MTANLVKIETALFHSGPSFMLLALAMFAISPAASSGWDFNRLVPANLVALVACLDLAAIKAMAFKTVVCGGFFLQNRSRFALLIVVTLALLCRLSRRTAASRRAAGRMVFAGSAAANLVAARATVARLIAALPAVARPPAAPRTGKQPALAWRILAGVLPAHPLAASLVYAEA